MAERGFTLLEVVVAGTLLAVGVLAVAASTAPLARLVLRGGTQAAGAAAAGSRIEAQRAVACGTPASIPGAGRGTRVSATLRGSGGLRELRVVATYPWGPGAHSDRYATAVACAR